MKTLFQKNLQFIQFIKSYLLTVMINLKFLKNILIFIGISHLYKWLIHTSKYFYKLYKWLIQNKDSITSLISNFNELFENVTVKDVNELFENFTIKELKELFETFSIKDLKEKFNYFRTVLNTSRRIRSKLGLIRSKLGLSYLRSVISQFQKTFKTLKVN